MRRVLAVATAALAALVLAPVASGRDPGRWRVVSRATLPLAYYQGVTSTPSGSALFFDGVRTGLYRTDHALRQTRGVDDVIPLDVAAGDGFNHVGDIGWDAHEGGRVLLPLECFDDARGNTCGRGALGVADPRTLAWRYYVRLDPRDIPKAMWNEVSPDGDLIWTSVRNDLIAYRARDVRRANAAPTGPLLRPVRRLPGAVPPTGVTGAAFYAGRLFLAGQDGRRFAVWSLDTRTGGRRLEIERRINGESEGLATLDLRGGVLHWLVEPISQTGPPTYPALKSTLLSFFPRHPRLRVVVRPPRVAARRAIRVTVRVSVRILGSRRAAAGAVLRLLGVRARADSSGRAVLRVRPPHAGIYRARAAWRGGGGVGRVRAVLG